MASTLKELQHNLALSFDEVTLIELLNVTTFDIVEKFSDEIEQDQDRLQQELEGTLLYSREED